MYEFYIGEYALWSPNNRQEKYICIIQDFRPNKKFRIQRVMIDPIFYLIVDKNEIQKLTPVLKALYE